MKIKHLTTLLLGIMMIGMVSCEYVTIEPKDVVIPDTPVSYKTDVEPVFALLNCTQCHPGLSKPDLRVDKSYASLISNNLLDTTTPANSKLMVYINNGHNTAANMTPTQKALILKWITEGAKNN